MLVTCPGCGTRVMPMRDGRCPSCREPIPDAPVKEPPRSEPEQTPRRPARPPRAKLPQPEPAPEEEKEPARLGRRRKLRAGFALLMVISAFQFREIGRGPATMVFVLSCFLIGAVGMLLTYIWPLGDD